MRTKLTFCFSVLEVRLEKVRNSQTLAIIKKALFNFYKVLLPLPWFYRGPRKTNITLCRIRNDCSSLNSHFYNNNLKDNPQCACRLANETPDHYFFQCTLFTLFRQNMKNDLMIYLPVDIELTFLLFESPNLTVTDTICSTEVVQNFINDTKRFEV